MEYIKFKEVKHKMPNDSWYHSLLDKGNEEFDEGLVLLIEGDYEVGNLDLGAPLIPFRERFNNYEAYLNQEMCIIILIEGNLKARNIYNFNTDRSTSLCVLGNVDAENIVIGGQELYVAGNLNVAECFWGIITMVIS